jgi:hypothetical protein
LPGPKKKTKTGGKMTEKKVKEDSKSVKSKMQTFEVGDLAVYPAHGVGQIKSIESRIVRLNPLKAELSTGKNISFIL